jgi:hypothetical protein
LRGSRRTPSPALAPPITAQLENVVVAGRPGIFAGNPVLLENRLRCQYYERTGCCLRNPRPWHMDTFFQASPPQFAVVILFLSFFKMSECNWRPCLNVRRRRKTV